MSRGRLALVVAFLAVLVGGSAFDVVTGREHWPFSPYPMYSRVELDPTTTKLQLAGLPRDPRAREVPLRDGERLHPFDKTRMSSALRRLQARPGGPRLLRLAARDVLDRYERRRRAGRLRGPALRAVRVYERRWRLRPDARNLLAPERERLVVEVSAAP